MSEMQWKIGYGLKTNVANALLQSTLDSGDLIITSDEGKEQIGFVKPDNSVVWMKAIPINDVFESMVEGESYIETEEAYAGQTVKVKMEDGKYHIYILQPSDSGYTLEEVGGNSDVKQYIIIGTRPESNQEQGIIYIDNNVGYIWNGDWQKIFEDVSITE